MTAVLVHIPIFSDADSEETLQAALQANPSRLYVLLAGDQRQLTGLLSSLAKIFDTAAVEKPCLDVIPLFPFAGWSTERIAAQEDLQTVVSSQHAQAKAEQLLQAICQHRGEHLQPIGLQVLPEQHKAEQAGVAQQKPASSVSTLGNEGQQLQFEHVAVGGTFDRLHAGHRILLAATALVSTSHVYIGITGDKLLEKKEHAHLLEPYETRRNAAIAYMQAVRPGLCITGGPLLDPKEPTAAATDERMQALVVSQETVAGAEAINQDRKQRRFPPLTIVVVDLVGKGSKELKGQKLSSTALRAKDAGTL